MEFVGNQISMKTVLATLIVAFFVGRVNLFGGTFPAVIALITVMVAVSTVYIYLVPVMALSMMTFYGQGAVIFGDMMAMAFCGIFFLFFHQHKFTINQRTALAVTAMAVFNFIYYRGENIQYMLDLQTLVQEGLALIIYIRVFNTLAKMLFVGKNKSGISGEKAGLALGIFAVSIAGAVGFEPVVFPLWILIVMVVLYCRGIQWAFCMTALVAVFWQCQYQLQPELILALFTAVLCGYFIASLVDGKYRKAVLAFAVFAVMAMSAGNQIYGVAVAMAVFTAVPSGLIFRYWCKAEEYLMPDNASDLDLRLNLIQHDLQKKRDTFRSLGRIYGTDRGKAGNHRMISYQFEGMARTVESILKELSDSGEENEKKSIVSFSVGEASYAYEEVSGDSSMSFSFGKNNQALIISDGMGKGKRASEESHIVVTTVSKLLEAGFDVDLAMKTVNSILMTENQDEMFASVDLAIINKENRRAQIFKMGAASTFVKHDGKVSILKKPALPVGVLEGVKLEYIDVRLKKGDLLIMVSDGVTDCDRNDPECIWLTERISQIRSSNPETVAELIVNKAAEKYGIRERDDLTVMVVAI